MRLLHTRQHGLRKEQGALADLAVDIVDGLRVLRGIGGERVFADRYRERSQRVRHEGVRVAGVESSVAAGRLLLPGLLVAVIVWLGAHLVGTGRMSPGALVAFYGYAVFLAEQLRRATSMVDQLTRALVAARMVTDLLAMEPALGSGDRDLDAEAARGPLRDPGSGLEIPPGRFVAVACDRPDDMLLLADRLGRYVDSPVTLGGTPLAEFPLAEVRRRILVVDHDARLFSGGSPPSSIRTGGRAAARTAERAAARPLARTAVRTAVRPAARTGCGARSTPPRPTTSSRHCPRASTRRSPAAGSSPAASGNG